MGGDVVGPSHLSTVFVFFEKATLERLTSLSLKELIYQSCGYKADHSFLTFLKSHFQCKPGLPI